MTQNDYEDTDMCNTYTDQPNAPIFLISLDLIIFFSCTEIIDSPFYICINSANFF